MSTLILKIINYFFIIVILLIIQFILMGSRNIYIINFAPFLHCYTHGIIIFKYDIGYLKGCYKLN